MCFTTTVKTICGYDSCTAVISSVEYPHVCPQGRERRAIGNIGHTVRRATLELKEPGEMCALHRRLSKIS